MDRIILERAEPDPTTGLPIGVRVTSAQARFPDATALSGDSVRLEPFDSQTHGDALWQVSGGAQHAELWQYMSEGPFADRASFDTALKRHSGSDPVFYAIVDQKTDLTVGRAAYLNVRPDQGVIEVGHLLFSPALQRTRGATEALFLLARHAFEVLGYRRYEWKCNALNAKSRQAAERTGFRFEGIFRQHLIVKGRNRDTAWFSILDSEWPIVRSAFDRWLAPGNFDSSGKQQASLRELMAKE